MSAKLEIIVMITDLFGGDALMPLVGRQEGIPAFKCSVTTNPKSYFLGPA